jgi:hypothetical protein
MSHRIVLLTRVVGLLPMPLSWNYASGALTTDTSRCRPVPAGSVEIPVEDHRTLGDGNEGNTWTTAPTRSVDPAGALRSERSVVFRLGVGGGLVQPHGSRYGSAPMLELARHRAHGHHTVEFVQADAQTDALGGPFDVAISRFGTMFFDDPPGRSRTSPATSPSADGSASPPGNRSRPTRPLRWTRRRHHRQQP